MSIERHTDVQRVHGNLSGRRRGRANSSTDLRSSKPTLRSSASCVRTTRPTESRDTACRHGKGIFPSKNWRGLTRHSRIQKRTTAGPKNVFSQERRGSLVGKASLTYRVVRTLSLFPLGSSRYSPVAVKARTSRSDGGTLISNPSFFACQTGRSET